MRLPVAALAVGLLALTAPAQITTHVKMVDVEDGYDLAYSLEQLGYDVVEGGTTASSIEMVVSDGSWSQLEAEGYTFEVIAVGRPYAVIQEEYFASQPEAVPVGYQSLAVQIARMNELEATFPAIAQVVNVTQTYGAPQTFEGRDIYAIKISDNVGQNEDEPSFLLVSNHHAREINTNVVAMETMTTLCKDYATDPAVQAVVDGNEIWIAPTWNPDGYEYVWNVNNNWRRNRAVNGGCTGVDLNRNYQAGWSSPCGGSSGCNDTYRGPSAGSEAETQNMILFTQAERFAKVLDFHSSGRETLWGYASSGSCNQHPWNSWLRNNAIAISQAGGYGNAERPPSANGEHYEWQMKSGRNYAHLIEISFAFQPSYASALAEAQQLFGSVMHMLELQQAVTGHTTDNCSGGPVDATIEIVGVSFPYNTTFDSGGAYGRYDVHMPAGNYTLRFSAPGYVTQDVPMSAVAGSTLQLDVELVATGTNTVAYCTAGTSASGCQAELSTSGTASATAPSGFDVMAADLEGSKDGLFFIGWNGRQANSWGNGTSFQCVVPPVRRAGLLVGSGTTGQCDGSFSQDLNALWCPSCPKPQKNPGAGTVTQVQLWYRDPQNTSNQTTGLSNAIEFTLCP